MKIAVPLDRTPDEPRAAIGPEAVKAYVKKGHDVAVEAGLGKGAYITDAVFKEAGATIAKDAAAAVADADMVLSVRRPSEEVVKALKPGAVVVGLLDPHGDMAGLQALAEAKASAFAMELMPRISRAQSMDVLSSQANLAGYKAVDRCRASLHPCVSDDDDRRRHRGADQTVRHGRRRRRLAGDRHGAPPGRGGVGHRRARRGGRAGPEPRRQVRVHRGPGRCLHQAGGYAKELSEDDRKKQAELIAEHIKTQDIVITTALIPGRPAPKLISKEMVESMKPGSVIVDMAAERGGNCELTKPGKTVTHKDVRVFGPLNLAGDLAGNATQLYARNLQNFVDLISKDGALSLDWDDEIVSGCGLIRDGDIVHPILKSR
jgi:H+-translocating NAD(P) transhydrogenase subunit alpha